jgi:O-antigen/teichoic acid export membrane protein
MAGQQRICAVVYTGTFALNVLLVFQLVPHFGLAGAAAATSTSLVVETVCLYFITARRLGICCSILAAWKRAAPAIGAAQ